MTELNTAAIRQQNKLRILNAVSAGEPFTKNELTESTGLTIVTVNKIINEFEQNGFVLEVGQRESVGGRRAKLYRLSDDITYFIGVNISPELVTTAICDINRNILAQSSVMLYNEKHFDIVWYIIKREVESLRLRLKIPEEKQLGIGITLPGIIDPEDKRIRVLPRMPGWEGIEIQKLAEEEFHCNVVVDNDINACAIGLLEKYSGDSSIALLIFQGGIGGSVLLDGQLLQGKHGMANEFGHLSVDINGPLCHCGNNGCLELYASDYAMVNDMICEMRRGAESLLWKICEHEERHISIETMIRAALAGDALCLERFRKSATYINFLLRNIIRIYELDRIIIQCQWLAELPGMLGLVREGVISNNIYFKKHRDDEAIVQIEVNTEPDLRLKGALMLAYNNFMSSLSL